MTWRPVVILAAITFTASLAASGAYAQGFGLTFGGAMSSDAARVGISGRAERKASAPARHCRLERHQVYDAQGQLIWRTIRVCG